MPRRTDISLILIIGAGPIVTGEAAGLDYWENPCGQDALGKRAGIGKLMSSLS